VEIIIISYFGTHFTALAIAMTPAKFVGLALVGKDIVFRFIIEYSSLRDFYGPLGSNNRSIYFYMRIFEK
jgi:hypothetical protein